MSVIPGILRTWKCPDLQHVCSSLQEHCTVTEGFLIVAVVGSSSAGDVGVSIKLLLGCGKV